MVLILHALISDFNPVWTAYVCVSFPSTPATIAVPNICGFFGTLSGPSVVEVLSGLTCMGELLFPSLSLSMAPVIFQHGIVVNFKKTLLTIW